MELTNKSLCYNCDSTETDPYTIYFANTTKTLVSNISTGISSRQTRYKNLEMNTDYLCTQCVFGYWKKRVMIKVILIGLFLSLAYGNYYYWNLKFIAYFLLLVVLIQSIIIYMIWNESQQIRGQQLVKSLKNKEIKENGYDVIWDEEEYQIRKSRIYNNNY
ncbi:MAG: hypothetical protein OEZ01_03915 [Candidatus Heimdallarchaeota archaeon]|nr:hypothetical protein [Candidatus Heimdallarchaeota archaeon]MDH5645125.1 hypothetical protein [Candidatus Heimdallarchaeota archaeon]